MSTKRARYDGPHQEVVVQDSAAGIYSEGWVVKRGGWLPDNAPAHVRDDLLASDEWTEVKQSDTQKKGSDD
jgi:hypothetical protein